MKTTCVWVTCVLSLIGAPISSAFAATATLTGRVTDSTGAVLPGATVTAANVDTNTTVSSVSNRDGVYALSNLATGTYRVTVELSGFQTIVKPDVQAHVAETITLDFELPVGSVLESVTVHGGAPLVKTTAEVSTLVDRQFVENLPLNGRSFQSLLSLTPGVVLTKATDDAAGQFSVNGQRTDGNYFMVDGVSANLSVNSSKTNTFAGQSGAGSLPAVSTLGTTQNLVAVDALQEFRVQTSTYAPEFGRMPGAQISMVTRSGTNGFHGTLFEYFRNDALDANDWFANSRGLPQPELAQNDFGGVLGGRIRRDRTFFFLSYEGLRLRQPQVQILSVPSLALRQSAVAAVRPYLNAFPLPTGGELPGGKAEFATPYTAPSNLNATSLRFDHTAGRMTVFGRVNYAPSNTSTRVLNQVNDTRFTTTTTTVGSTWTLSDRANNDLRVNVSQNIGGTRSHIDDFGGGVGLADSAVFFVPFQGNRENRAFAVAIGGDLSYTEGLQNANEQHQFNVVDTFSLLAGNHHFKVGLDYRRLTPLFTGHDLSGFVFTDLFQAATGVMRTFNITVAAPPRTAIIQNVSAYAQDTWQAAPRLSLTYGIRWDYNPAPTEANGNSPATITSTANLSTLTVAPLGTPLWNAAIGNVGPRFGAAYRLSERPTRESVLRGGFGIFHDLGLGQIANSFGDIYPYITQNLIPNVALPLSPTQITPPALRLGPPYTQIWTFDPQLKLPYTIQWNLALEQSIGANQTWSASYVGAAGRRLLKNDFILGPMFGGPAPADFLAVNITQNAGSSDYRALQLQYRRRMANGFQALASYTWARSTDNVSSDKTSLPSLSLYDPERDRGASDFDLRHAFSSALTYTIPAPMRKGVRALFGGWSADTVFTARSGFPIDISGFRSIGFGASYRFRPDLVPNVPIWIDDPLAGGGRRLNRAAFVIPADRQGNLTRNSIRGFNVWQADLALRRQLRVTDAVNLQLRVELFNIFNHPTFADPVGSITSGTFGQSTQSLSRDLGGVSSLYQLGGPRSTQLALKLLF